MCPTASPQLCLQRRRTPAADPRADRRAARLQTLGEALEEALEEERHLSVDAAGLAQRAAQNEERRALLGEALAVGLCVRLCETGPQAVVLVQHHQSLLPQTLQSAPDVPTQWCRLLRLTSMPSRKESAESVFGCESPLSITINPIVSSHHGPPSMLTEIKTSNGSQFAFAFPSRPESVSKLRELAGERYRLGFNFCDNPVCRCGVVSVRLFPDAPEYAESDVPVFEVSVNVLAQKSDAGNRRRSVSEQHLGDTFVGALSAQDWQLLHRIFDSHKRQLTNETPDEKIDAPFPADDIEQYSAMVRFHSILPYAEVTILDIENRRFQLDALYCVKSDCTCTDVAVCLLDLSAPHDAAEHTAESPLATLFLNYHTRTWRIEDAGDEDPQLVNRIAETLSSDSYASAFQRQHDRLKALYRGYQSRHSRQAAAIPTRQPVGRNDPCPCGSGKKYKKCCLNAPRVS